MSLEGMVATMTIEAATDAEIFLAYLDHVLCPRLRARHVVVMDNLSSQGSPAPTCSICRPTRPTLTPSKKA
jgi:hypothetical protein